MLIVKSEIYGKRAQKLERKLEFRRNQVAERVRFGRIWAGDALFGPVGPAVREKGNKEKLTIMVSDSRQLEEVNVLASDANWAWPAALQDIFRPRGVNLLVAKSVDGFVNIIGRKRIHTTIVDMDSERSNGLATIKIIRMNYPLLPCILLSSEVGESVLSKALRLDVFSVIDKPVDMGVLREQLNRLFMKKYNSGIFA